MTTVMVGEGPIAAGEAERAALNTIVDFLARQQTAASRLVAPDGESILLPESAVRLLRHVIEQLAQDNAVAIVLIHKHLTTQQAADILNISRQYLVRLLERGEIPFERVGTHRRLKFGDVMAYRQRRNAREEAALDDFLLSGDALGL